MWHLVGPMEWGSHSFLGLPHTGPSHIPHSPGPQGPPPSCFSCTPSPFWPFLLQSPLLLTPGPVAPEISLMVVRQKGVRRARYLKTGERLDLDERGTDQGSGSVLSILHA